MITPKNIFIIIGLMLFSPINAEIKVGDKAPTFFANTLDNQYFFLSDTLKLNKPIVLDFFATWCVPCIQEMPLLDSLSLKYPTVNFYFVNVSNLKINGHSKKEDPVAVRKLIQRLNINSQVLMDKFARIVVAYGATELPKVVIINNKGIIEYLKTGYESGDELIIENKIIGILSEIK